MRGVLLWLLGIPIPIIILLYVIPRCLSGYRRAVRIVRIAGDPRQGVPSAAHDSRAVRDAGGPKRRRPRRRRRCPAARPFLHRNNENSW